MMRPPPRATPFPFTTHSRSTKVYGNSDPVFTYAISTGSLAYSDAFTGSLRRDTAHTVGCHIITSASQKISSDYTLTFVSKDFSITARAVEHTADPRQTKVYR